MNTELKLLKDGVDVKRFHTVSMHFNETVGHHQGLVCGLLTLCFPELRKEVWQYASLHDVAECVTGDTPADTKRNLVNGPTIKAALDALEDRVMADHKVRLPELTDYEYNVLKRCDYAAGMITCHREFKMGNSLILTQFKNFLLYYRRLASEAEDLGIGSKIDSFVEELASDLGFVGFTTNPKVTLVTADSYEDKVKPVRLVFCKTGEDCRSYESTDPSVRTVVLNVNEDVHIRVRGLSVKDYTFTALGHCEMIGLQDQGSRLSKELDHCIYLEVNQ